MAAAVFLTRMPPGSTSGVGSVSSSSGFPGWLSTTVSPLGTALSSSRFQSHVLAGAGEGEQGDQSQTRHGHPRSRRVQPAQLPDRDEAGLVVELLLDLVKKRLALLPVALPGLLGVPDVDLGILDPRLGALARHEGIQARGRAAERARPLQGQGLVGLLA